jgi:Ca2+-binding EF-hand superfamily protein
MHSRQAAVAALIALAAFTAYAAEPSSTSPPVDTARAMLDRMDRNQDGKISLEEYRNAMIRRFGAQDHNDDGVLEGDEFPPEWLAGADAHGAAGKVSFEQFAGELPTVFARFDANRDGQLEADEIAAFAAARKAHEGTKR